jgi:hypothetical protein
MMRELSANGESLGRRRFLGLGAGAAVFGSASPSLSPVREGFILGGDSTPMSEYERRLSETTRMELLGCPPDWSVIDQRYHPFHPLRIVVLPSGAALNYGSQCGWELRRELDDGWPFTGVVAVPGIEVSARASPFANGRPLVLQAMDLGSSPLRAARSAAPVLDFVTGVWLSGRPGPNGPCT